MLLINPDELIIDNFAGGGGASLGIGMALGRSPDIAINHDAEAIAMHRMNHPETRHYCENIRDVDPAKACGGRRVGLAWFSPDCKHFSKAKGAKPVEKKIRGLARIVIHWARKVRPRVIILENVEEFQDWGPLLPDNTPCPKRKGKSFLGWKSHLTRLGYHVEWRELRACDYGAPTIRKRLFVVARCDGLPIVWPDPTHGDPKRTRHSLFDRDLAPWRTAAECIDWSISCPSIFERQRPLAENTLRRIAAGLKRYVIEAAEPFIVNLTHDGGRIEPIGEPLRTVTGANRGEKALCTPFLAGVGGRAGQSPARSPGQPYQTVTAKADAAVVMPFLAAYHSGKYPMDHRTRDLADPLGTQTTENRFGLVAPYLARIGQTNGNGHYINDVRDPVTTVTSKAEHLLVSPTLIQTGYGERDGQKPRVPGLDKPLGTAVAGGQKHALVSAFLARHYGKSIGSDLAEPNSTATARNYHGLVASHLVKLRGTCRHGQPVTEPMATISAQGNHIAEVRAFLVAYFGTQQDPKLTAPLHTVTSHDRFGLVTVHVEDYLIADIGLRMLTPRELFRAQGFPDGYDIELGPDGKPLSKTAQVRMCGNSVAPPIAAAVARAQFEAVAERITA